MKHVVVILMLSLSTVVQAQPNHSRVETRISDDSQTLLIQIDAYKHGRQTHYKQTFDVSDMNGLQIDLLKYRVFAAQGTALPIHEMPRLRNAAIGLFILILLIITFLIVRYQTKKVAQLNLEKSLRIG